MFNMTKEQVELPGLSNFILKGLKTKQNRQKNHEIFWLTVITELFPTIALKP